MSKLIIILLIIISGIKSQTWVSQNSGTTEQVFDIFFVNDLTGYASCSGGVLLKTTNSGNNWISVPGPYSGNIMNVVFFDINTGIVFSNPVFKTTNAGSNWFQAVNLSGTLHHSMMADSTTIYGCQPFQLSKTTDRGNNWSVTSSTPPWTTTSAFFINQLTGWVTSIQPIGMPVPTIYKATISKTSNGGTNWTILHTEDGAPETNLFRDIYFPSQDTGIIIGKSGNSIYRTFNGGVNWNEVSLAAGLTDLYFINSKTGWAVNQNGFVYKTISSGSTWINTSTPVSVKLNAIRFINLQTGWAVGLNGSIIKSTNGGVTGITAISNEIPNNFSLSQNYPNPFNPLTKIRFAVLKSSFTKIIIYDLLGREVTTLVNEELSPGTYEADWDASSFSSGVYFYKIISGEIVETKKMVLMK